MSYMFDVYNNLKDKKYFIDNEYLIKYCQLIEVHTRHRVTRYKTHKHHIIPKSWFKLTNCLINNDLNNLVNLPHREHVLAHYYLCLCTTDPFKYANELALFILLKNSVKNSVDKQLLYRLPLYNYIYEDYTKKLKSHYDIYRNNQGVVDDNKGNC